MSVRDAAAAYLARGWCPIPVPWRSKDPGIKGWPSLRITAKTLENYFGGANHQNIGILLGEPSGGLADVDADCPEAVIAGRHLLPDTGCVFGRDGNPSSHLLFIASCKTRKFTDPQGNVLVELRSTGCQTLAPPSAHPSGEIIEWVADNGPATVEGERLARLVSIQAAASLLARAWPAHGRHDAALALAGGLKRAGWALDQATLFVQAVADAARDEESGDRVRATSDTFERGGNSTGWPRLGELLGRDVVTRGCEWLDIRPSGASSAAHDEGKRSTRPVIDVRAGVLPRIVQDALVALKDAGTPIFHWSRTSVASLA